MKKVFLFAVIGLLILSMSSFTSSNQVVNESIEMDSLMASQSFNYTTQVGVFSKNCTSVTLNGKSHIILDVTNTGNTTVYIDMWSSGSFPGGAKTVSLGAGSGICFYIPISGWTGHLKLNFYDYSGSTYAKGAVTANAS